MAFLLFTFANNIVLYPTSGYNHKDTPTLQLKGSYLQAFGFRIGDPVTVHLEDRRIVIVPREEETETATN